MARWAIVGASLLAAFQLWLWVVQGYLLGALLALVTMFALGFAAWRPGSAYARSLTKARVLKRAIDESERAYWFRVSLTWVLVAVVCLVGALGIPSVFRGSSAFLTLVVALFYSLSLASICMALQSFRYCIVQSAAAAPPNNSLERTRER
jgi:hypothetical protein